MFDTFFKAQKNLGRVSNNSKKYFKLILIVLIIGAFLEFFLSVSLLFPVF